jgi:hypothetical protein
MPVVTPKIDHSKKIKKVELEEKRSKAKQRENEKKGGDIQGIPAKLIPEGFENADPKTREKMIRMMKNRISAQQSREKKKQKYQTIEQEIQYHRDEAERLQRELNDALKLVDELKRFIKLNLGIDYPTPTLNMPMNVNRGSSMRGFMNTGFLVLGLVCVICLTMVNPGSDGQIGHGNLMPNPYKGHKSDVFDSQP